MTNRTNTIRNNLIITIKTYYIKKVQHKSSNRTRADQKTAISPWSWILKLSYHTVCFLLGMANIKVKNSQLKWHVLLRKIIHLLRVVYAKYDTFVTNCAQVKFSLLIQLLTEIERNVSIFHARKAVTFIMK